MGGFWLGLLWAVYLGVCFLLILIVLIQRGETGGLSSAFGGGGGETAFGVKADVTWKRATAWFAGIFMLLALVIGSLMGTTPQRSVAGTGEAPPAGAEAPAGEGGQAPPAGAPGAAPAAPAPGGEAPAGAPAPEGPGGE